MYVIILMIFFLNEDQVTLGHRSGDLRQSVALPSARLFFLPRRHEDTKGFFSAKNKKMKVLPCVRQAALWAL